MKKDRPKVVHEERDEKGRPLFLIRDSGQVLFFRYDKMSNKDKESVCRFYTILEKKGLIMEDGEGNSIEDIRTFLGFEKDHDICG